MDEEGRKLIDAIYERWKNKGYKVGTIDERINFLGNRTGLNRFHTEGQDQMTPEQVKQDHLEGLEYIFLQEL
jgi:hypothetical protein